MEERVNKIVAVRYESKASKGTFEGREYSYFTKLDVTVGEIVECPTRYGPQIGIITKTDIKEEEIIDIKQYMKEILIKYNKEDYLQGKFNIEEVIRYGTESK